MDDNIKKLHQALIDDGYDDVGTEQEFRDYVSDSKNVATLYNALSEAGYDNFKDQKSLETYLSGKAPVAQKPSTPQSSGQSVSSKEKKQTQYPQEVIDAFNSPDNKPGNFKDLAQLNDEYQRGELKKPGIISQALGMFSNVDAGNVGKEQKVGGMIANMLLGDNMQQPQQPQQSLPSNTPSQEPSQFVQMLAEQQQNQTLLQTKVQQQAQNEALMDAKLANYIENWKQRPDKEGDYFENMVADLLADGTANSNEEAVNMVMPALRRYAHRSAMDVTNQVVSSLPDDTVQDAEQSIGAQWYSHGVQDKLKQEADSMGISYDDYVAHFLKPAMVQSLVNKYGPNYRNIAEGIATRLYSHDENVQDRLMNQDINDALSNVINKYVSPSVVDEYNKAQEAGSKAFLEGMEGSQFIPANLRLGTALGAQYEANEAKDPAKVLSGLQQKFGKLYRNPKFLNDMSNAAFKVMQRYGMNGTLSGNPKQFKPMINAAIKNELDQLEIKGMMPKGSAEYIMKTGLGNTIAGKIIRKAVQTDYQNWLEDIANQQYQPGFWENVASGALTFAGDAWSYWLPGAAGGKLTKSMVAKAEGKLAGDLMAKGMERKMAERAAKVLIGKSKAAALKSGAVHGAVTFGGQSAISKPIDETYRTGQFDENGKIYNPSVGKVIANTLGEVAKQSAVGAIMQGGTIANMVGKGRGLAANILADVGGKVVDSGIMTGHQMLERMAQDPNFKPTGKDAAESFLESMANLTAIGLPGMVGKYARFKDAREFNKKFDFTDQDIAELKRFGYDGLRDAFEKMGIGEYAVVGENAQRLDGQLTQKYMDLMNDKSVPEVLKAKMMAVVEGKRPSSFSPVVDSEVYRGDDGKYYLETYNKDGGVIDRKEYSSHDAARNDEKKLEYEKTLGLASVLEGEFHNEFTQEHLEGLYNKAAQKYNMGEKLTDEDKAAVYLHQNAGAIKEIMDKQQKGIILTDEEQKQINAYRHYYDSALENSSVMREFVNTFEDSNGVARGTLRKALESKDKKYAPLVESYLKELYNSIELKREMKQTMDDLYNTSHGNEQKRIEGENPVSPVEGSAGGQEPPVSEGPASYQDRTKSVPTPSDAEVAANPANVSNSSAEGASPETKVAGSDAFVMGQNAYKNGDSEALQAIDYNSDLATGRLKRAFADNEKMPDIVANAYNEGRDMEQFVAQRASSLTPAQKEAISKYVEAMDAKKGAIDALQHADDGYGEALKEQLWPYQTEDGNIMPATLDSGKQVFLKKANEYGGAFVVVPDEQGQPMIKQVSNAEIKEVGTPVSLDEYIENAVVQQKDARAQQFISQFDGSGLKPNDQVTVAMEEGDANINMTFAGYSKDGKIVLTDGKDYLPLSKEEFAAWRKNALDNTINEHLDAEDDEREQAQIKKAEADKQERYKKGIFGYAVGKPDYSDTQTDPKVAAEYLQETAGEDRKTLFANIVAEKQALQKRINQLREHIANNEEWLSVNADLDPENAETRSLANKQMQGQIVDLQARFDNWNKIRSSVMTPEEAEAIKTDRTKKIAEAGVNDGDVAPIEGREVAVLSDEELKKQYPTMDEASSYITSERKKIYRIQSDEVQREIDGVDDVLDRYVNGEIDLEPEQLKELNTTKAQLQARQQNLTESAKDLKAQADKLKTLYRKENMEARAKAMENMTPAEQRAVKVENAIKTGNLSLLNAIYEEVRGATDFTDTEPNTIEEYVASNIGRFSLNYEGKDKAGVLSNGIKQETGLGRKDFDKLQILAKEGEGKTVPEFVHILYDNMPEQLKQMGYSDQDIRDAFLNLIGSVENYSDLKNYTLNNKVAVAEQQLRTLEHQEEEMMEEATSYEINDETAPFADRLETAISETETNPTEAQKKAGNYKKGHLTFGGYDFTVETPKGVTRSGKDEQGKPWSVTMHDTYGYILGKIGVDGDHIDMFINDAADLDTFDGNVYVVDQVNPETGEFDEHKVMYGYPDEAAATKAYLSNYSKGWKGLGKVTSVPKATFDKWLESSDRKTKPFREYAMIQHEEAKKAKQANEALPFEAPMSMDDLPFHRDVKEVKPENLTEVQKVAYDAVSTMLKKAGIPVKVVSNEDMEKVAEAQDNLNLAMLLNQPEMRFKIKTPEEKKAAENAYNFAKELRPDKWKQYAVVDMSNPNKMPEYFEKQELARKERSYYNKLMWGNYKVFNLDKSFEDNVAGLTGSFPSEFDPYKIDEQTNKRNELKKQMKETEEAYKSTGQECKEYQNQLMKEYMDEHGLDSENDIPDDVWSDLNDKAHEKYQDKLDSLFAKYKDLDRQLKAVAEPGVRFLRTYHGSGANFSEFDFDHMSEGAGSQVFGWGGYVTSSKKIGKDYASIKYDPDKDVEYVGKNKKTFTDLIATLFDGGIRDYNYVKNTLLEISDNDKSNISKKEEYDWFVSTKPEDWFNPNPTTNRNLYEVNIPEDNGSNYLEWEKKPSVEVATKIIEGLYGLDSKTLDDMASKDIVFRTLLYDYIKNADKEQMIPLLVKTHALTRGTTYDNGNVEDDIRFVYNRLSRWMGSPKAASRFLSSLGFTGIKYPAGTIMGGAEKGDTNYVIFNPKDMKIVDHTKFAQGKGVVYGYTDGKEIVLNQEHLNANTPIHEYQHLWRTAAKEMNPELIEHGDKLIMQTQLFADLKEDPNYKHLSDDEICDEAFARLTGEDGAAILEQMAKDAIKENPLDTAKELSVINKLKEWLKKFWYWTLDTFTKWKPEDIKKMTLEDIRNLVLRDLAQGVDPRTKLHEAENADDIKFMGSTTKKRMKNIASQFEGRKLDEAQQVVADVYSGKDNNRDFSFTNGGSERTMVMRQGNDDHAGTKHSVYRHFGVSKNYITIDDILSLPKILNVSTRKPSKKGTIEYSYTDKESGVTYTVVTKPVGNKEHFQNFYSDRKANPSDASHVAEGNTYTPEGARKTDGNTFMAAKVDNNSETAKGNGGNLSVEDKIKAVSLQFGVDEADVAMYANAIKKGSTAEAARARANIKRHLLQANEDKISSLKELLKYTKPVNEALKETFGDVDAMIEERVKQVEAQRNAMEAARKRAEEEEAKRQKHLEELSVIPDDQLDKQYMDALANGDDATAREMLDEAARRKGYDDTESAYQGVGAWAAPGNPGYESDKARRDDWEYSGSDVNLEDMALGYTPQPDDYFSHPERYSQNTPHGLESVKAINTAIDAIKNGEKDVKVKVYRAVPTSVKEGKLRNGDWVTPSKKYADMHGANRLEGKYRIIEDEVPANQLWWDGNDANEFGFDDGKAYKYKNAKNNRKLNDLVTYDDKGDVIPPSKRFNSRKRDVRFMFAGEKGAAEVDKAEEKTYRMDNLKVAEKMERGKKDAKAIKLATGWERGADGKWRYEMPDAKIKDMKDIGGGNIVKRFEDDMFWNDGKLADVIDSPGLFEAYPQLKDVRIDTDAIMNDMPSNGVYNAKTNTITIHADELKYMNSILNHEIQHAIQYIEGFGKGGSPEQMEKEFKAAQDEWKARAYAHELEEKAKEMGGEYNQSEVEKALVEEYKDLDMSDELPDKETRIKGFNYFARGYADRSMDDAIKRFRLNESTRSDFDSYKEYLKLAGEVESRNVEKRLGMTDEERRNSLASETEDVNRDEQIVMNGNDASYSIVKDPETIKKLGKEDTVKVYRAMQVGEDGKLYPPMAAKVKGKFVQPIELGKWEQADERPELADDKGMFTLNKGNGKSLKAAYNPYLHTSRTPLNDQFSEAQNRPNIVTVEVEVPKSELTSGYKADKAKDAVGEVEWKAGIIQGQLTGKRKVVLSRWDKPVRIVPDSEVADVIVNDMFKGKNITMPSNVVTPSLRKELEKRGVPFVETDNRGRIVGGENDGVHYSKVYGKNHREKGYRSILKFSLGDNGTDIADGNGDSINKNPNKNVITRRIGSREQAQRRVNETLGAAASDRQRSLGATTKEQRTTWNRRSALGYVRRRAEELSSLLTEKDLEEVKGIFVGHGQENYVYRAKYDPTKVIKFNDFGLTDNLFRINEFIDRVNAHNQFQPKDKYTPIGFAYDEKGDFCIVMEQPYLKGTTPTREEITQYLTDHGFKLDMIQISADEVDLGWTNGEFDLWDAEPRNVIKDENGDLHFFDTMIQHTYIPNHKNPLRLSMPSIRTFESQEMKNSADKVKNVANVLGGAEAVTYTSSADVPEEYRVAIELGAKGWYDPTTHTVHVYLPNCADANEAQRTVFHEKIGHEGMEVLLGGEDEVRKFANFVYNSVAASTRGKILEIANEYDPDWKNPDRMNIGTQEYIAHLAEEGPKTAEDFTLWTKIKHYLIRFLKKLGIRVPGLLNDKDLRYYLMKAGKALHVWDNMPKEKQEAMMKQASNAEIKDALSDGAGKGKPRQKKGESTIQYMKRVQEWRKWQNAREDENDPEPPMFYDIDKDEAGKKEWAQLNKDWRERHHLAGEEPMGMPIRMEGEEDGAYMTRIHEYEKWKEAMKDQEDPMPDMFAYEKKKQEEVKRKYEDWLARHELLEQQQADLDLYEGKIYPAETNPKADALEQQVMQDLAEVTSTDVSKEGAARSVHDAVIYRRKNIESASADDAIFINSVKQELNKMANASYLGRKADAIADAVKETVTGKSPKTQAKKMAEAIPYIIEAPRRMRDIADEMNAVGAFENGHIHVTAKDIDAIQPFTDELRVLASKSHKIEKDGKETIVYDDVPSMTEVASKMAKAINDNHVGEEGFVPVDGTDILAEHVLPVVLKRIVPEGVEYKNLSEEMQALLDKIREWYDKTFTWLKDSHTVREDIGYTNDYVNHRWDKKKSDDKAYADLVEGRQRTKSPNEKPRKVSTYMEGVDAGLVPKTTDITDLLAYYSQSNIEAFANKTFLQELSGINVIERNKDGEITSSMPLLTSIQPKEMMVDENKYTPYVVPGINTVWVYNQGKIFNKSAEDWFNAAFGTVKLPKVLKGVKNAMSIAKTLELGFSGFHAGALTEVYAVQNSAEFGPAKAMAYFMKYLITDTAKNHQLPAFANPDVFKEAAKHLVKFGSASDYATADIENLYEKVHSYVARLHSKLVEGNVAMKAGSSVTFPLEVATELLRMSQKGLDVALWSYLHDGLKLATYQLRAERTSERAKKLDWDEDMLNKALDEDGQFVNDMFGGQHFDVLGISKKMQTILDFIFLSKDWLVSTTRHALSIFGYGSIWNEASIKNFWEYYKHVLRRGEMTKEDYLRLSRSKSGLLCYGIGFMIGYEGLSQLVNAAMRAWDEEKQKEKADEIRKTNPSYKSPYELAYPDGMHWYDYRMRGNSLGQQSKIFMGRYADGTEMYIRHGKQFREIPELFFDAKDNFAIPGPMVRRMYGKASPLLRGMIDAFKWYLSPDYGDKEMQRKYGENLGLIPKLGSYYVPFAVPTQKDKEFKMLDLVFPSSKGFSRYKAQDYFKTFIMSEDKQGLAMTYNACVQNGIDPEVQLKAAISSVKALEASEMSDGVTSLQEASKRFDAAKSITEKKKMRQKMKKFLSQSDYKAFTQKEALDMVQGYLNGDEDLKEMEKAESKYLMKAKAEDVTEDWRIQNVWNGTMETYQEYQRLKDVGQAKANAFKNSKTNKRLFAARKAIYAARRKMNKAKKQMDGTNDAAKLVEIRNTRKELLEKLNGME